MKDENTNELMPVKATELRIGNRTQNQFGECGQISAKGIEMLSKGIGVTYPIPLTEEWLIKLGFGKDDTNTYIHESLPSGTGVYFESGNDWNFDDANICGDFDECIHVKLPQYVHQLQNLYFALTGKELSFPPPLSQDVIK